MVMDELQFEEQPVEDLSVAETPSINVPSLADADTRAQKYTYALEKGPEAVEGIKSQILSGEEPRLRQSVAWDEDIRLQQARLDLMAMVARASGKDLHPEDAAIIAGLTKAELASDPATILEKKFADKYIADVLNNYGHAWENIQVPVVLQEAELASSLKMRQEFYQRGLEDIQSEISGQGWGGYLADIGGTMIPFLPWWRQKHALENRPGVELMPGSTMAENVAYLHALPFQKAQNEYKKAMDYLRSKNLQDAQLFAHGMVSFSTSDELLGDLMGVADYTTGASIFGKAGARLVRGKAVVTGTSKADPLKVVEEAKKGGPAPLEPVREPPRTPEQLDLFGEQPQQGAFRFMNDPPSLRPPNDRELPGRFRATHEPPTGRAGEGDGDKSFRGPYRDALGRARRKSEELDLPLNDVQPAQGSLDLGGRTATAEEKYAAAISARRLKELEDAPQAIKEIRHALADAVKATEGNVINPETVLAANGDTIKAGVLGALRILQDRVKGIDVTDLAKAVPTFANPHGFLAGSKVIARERSYALAAELQKQGEGLLTAFMDAARGSRTTPEALKIGLERAEEGLRREYGKRLGDSILDVRFTPADMNKYGNVDEAYLVLGRNDRNLFDSEASARMHAKDIHKLGDKEYRVTQQGKGFQIEIPRHVREDDDLVRDGLVTPKNQTNTSMVNMLANRLRSSADILSPFQHTQRVTATHAPQEVRKAIRDVIAKDIEGLPKKSLQAVEDILRLNRDMDSVKYPGERGRWYDTAAEFETAFMGRHKRMPTEAEIKAYDTFKRLSDFDWLQRNTSVYRDKARVGIEGWRFRATVDGKPVTTNWFEGKSLGAFPWSKGKSTDHDAGIYIWDSSTQTGRFHYKFNTTPDERKMIDHLVENEGYRVVQVFDPKKRPLEGIAQGSSGPIKDQIHFVVTNGFEKKALDWAQVDYRPGGHVIYPGGWYVKQPVITIGSKGRERYFGDNSVMNFSTEAEAKKWAARMDEARILYKSGRTEELKTFLSKNLPHTYDEFTKMFKGNKPLLSVDHPIVHAQEGKSTMDTATWLKGRYDGLVDDTKNPYDLSNFMDKSYLADRDNILKTIEEGAGGAMQLSNAAQLDPYVALNKAMGQAMRNVWMNDYKIQAIESWLKEFADVMRPREDVLAAHPTFFLYNPQWKEGISDRARLSAAKAAQRAIVNFVGAQSEIGAGLSFIEGKLMNSIYKVGGQKAVGAVEKVGRFTEHLGLSSIKDPVNFLRAIAFHSKLGVFNPVQLFVQAQSMANSIAVAGLSNGLPGVAGAVLARVLAHNPAQLDTMARVASKMGWKAEEFKEMYQLMRSSGVYQVAGEAALRDDVFDPKLFQSTVGAFLDKGTMFFNEGERLNRLTAFASAYKEFRRANPTAKIGGRELNDITTRSDLLAVNMTRASNAAWQSGPLSVPTQFFAYNARLMEQLLGNRLTGAEKLRSLATYSSMYGIPIGIGAAVGVYPVYDDVQEYAIANNIDMNPLYMKGATEGLVSLAFSYIAGRDYNVAARYGPGNNSTIRDALRGDKDFLEIALGASGSILGDLWKTTYPFQYMTASVFSNTGEYPVQSSDWMNLFRNISSVDVAAKAYAVSSYGKWMTKSGSVTGEADGLDAAMAVLGLTPKHIADVATKRAVLKNIAGAKDSFAKDALHNYMLSLQYLAAGDLKASEAYRIRAKTAVEAGDFTYEEQSTLFQRGMAQGKTMEDKVNWDLLRKQHGSKMQDQFRTYFKDKK